MNRKLSIFLLLSSILSGEHCLCNDPITDRGKPLSLLYPQTDCYRYDVEASFLYWQGLSDGFDYVYTYLDNRTLNGTPFESDASVEKADFSWKASPRVSIGISGTDWDSKATWTYYEDRDSAAFEQVIVQPDTGVGAIARQVNLIWLIQANETSNIVPGTLELVTEAQAFAKLKCNTIDWVAGTSIAFNEHYYFRPYFGLKAAWLLQRLTVNGFNGEAVLDEDYFSTRTRMSNLFRALGVSFGGENKFRVNDWFSFYADGALAILVGVFDMQQNQSVRFVGLSPFVAKSSSDLSHTALRPAVKLAAGFDLNYPFCRSKFIASLSGGYEVNYWPLQTHWYRFFGANTQFKHPGDLILHGAVVKGAFVF